MEAFAEYFEDAEEKGQILEFVSRQLESDSPRTRKEARKFLERWGDSP